MRRLPNSFPAKPRAWIRTQSDGAVIAWGHGSLPSPNRYGKRYEKGGFENPYSKPFVYCPRHPASNEAEGDESAMNLEQDPS